MPQGKGTYGEQVGRPPEPHTKKIGSGFKMKGWSAFTKDEDALAGAIMTGAAEGMSEMVAKQTPTLPDEKLMMQTTKKLKEKEYEPQTVKPKKDIVPQTQKNKDKKKDVKDPEFTQEQWDMDEGPYGKDE